MTFRIGQKVVCIHDFTSLGAYHELIVPTKDAVYTIRELEDRAGCPAVLLYEITNPPRVHKCGTYAETSFELAAFRPLVDKQADISFAHEILRKVSKTKEMAV